MKLAVKQWILIGQKLAKNAKIEKLKWDILGDFQTLKNAFRVIRKKVSQYIWDFSGLIKVLKMIDEFCLLITSSSCQHWFGFSFQLYTFFPVSTALCTRPVENWWQEAKTLLKLFFSPLIQILLCMKKTKKLYCWQQRKSICP